MQQHKHVFKLMVQLVAAKQLLTRSKEFKVRSISTQTSICQVLTELRSIAKVNCKMFKYAISPSMGASTDDQP